MLVSSIVGFNFGRPAAKGAQTTASQPVQTQTAQHQNHLNSCCPKGRKHAPKAQYTHKLSLLA